MIDRLLDWVDGHSQHRTPVNATGMNNRINVAVIALVVANVLLSGI